MSRQPMVRATAVGAAGNGRAYPATPAANLPSAAEVIPTTPESSAAGPRVVDSAARRRPDGLPVGRPFQKGQRGPGRPPGSLNRPTREVRDLARKLLENPLYLKALKRRLREGSAPMIEALLYHYGYGKPVDRVRITGTFGHVDLVGALQQAWGQLRGQDPRVIAAAVIADNGQPALPPKAEEVS